MLGVVDTSAEGSQRWLVGASGAWRGEVRLGASRWGWMVGAPVEEEGGAAEEEGRGHQAHRDHRHLGGWCGPTTTTWSGPRMAHRSWSGVRRARARPATAGGEEHTGG